MPCNVLSHRVSEAERLHMAAEETQLPGFSGAWKPLAGLSHRSSSQQTLTDDKLQVVFVYSIHSAALLASALLGPPASSQSSWVDVLTTHAGLLVHLWQRFGGVGGGVVSFPCC